MQRWSRLIPLTGMLLIAAIAVPGEAQVADPSNGGVLVRYRAETVTSQRTAARSRIAAERVRRFDFIDVELLRVTGDVDAAIRSLEADPNVLYAEPDRLWSVAALPDDPAFPQQWNLRNVGQTGGVVGADVDAESAWDIETGDQEVLIGVVDTGIDHGHEDLIDNVWTNPGEIPDNGIDDDRNGWVDDVHGYDFFNDDGDPFDDHGHGTHVAGIIASRGNNARGTAGVMWRARIVGLKFLSSQGVGPTSDAIEAIEYAVKNGIRITNHSWGGFFNSQALYDAIAVAGGAGHLVVAAAGNRAIDIDAEPFYPAAYDLPNILSVAATNSQDAFSAFSNRGVVAVDIGAPGEVIMSTFPGNQYGLLSGTSMAAPHASGAAGLLLGRFPTLSAGQIKSLIMTRAEPLPSLAGKVATGARLNLLSTISDPDSTPPGRVADLGLLDVGSNSATIRWTATGDDGESGRPFNYEVRFATFPIDSANVHLTGRFVVRATHAPGEPETLRVDGLETLTSYYFAVRAADEFNNLGGLSGWVVANTLGPPRAELDPPGITLALRTGESATRTLTLSNVLEGTLDFTLEAPVFRFPDLAEASALEVPTAVGGPDAFGYRWDDSRDSEGPRFDWVDITESGALLDLTGDDVVSEPVDLGFRFPFYGTGFDSVHVCTNGWLSFTSTRAQLLNLPLPFATAPENLIAAFWDDLSFGIERKVRTWTDGTRFVATWDSVYGQTGGGPYTFQVVLFPSGEMRFQYREMGFPVTSATVGIQNATRDVGLLMTYNDDFVEGGLAVRIAPLPDWARTDVREGRVLAGQSMEIPIAFDASGLLAGAHAGSLVVASNDPDRPRITVPLELSVTGAPDVDVSPVALEMGDVFAGTEQSLTLRVRNVGTDVLEVSGVSSNALELHVPGEGFVLPPNTQHDVSVRYAPDVPGVLIAEVAIQSNDPDTPDMVIPVNGAALDPPVFEVATDTLSATLGFGRDTVRTLRVWNRGGTVLDVVARAAVSGGSTAARPAPWNGVFVPAGKGEAEPAWSLSAAAEGGPDAFGYSWRDGSVAGGPAFEWIDVREVGTVVPIIGDDVTSSPVDLGFSFPFYGQTFEQVRICTNGWLSFTSGINAFTNTPLPIVYDGVPENLLAVMWDDLHFGAEPRVWVWTDGSRFIAQYQEVGRFGEGLIPNTFQVILLPDGRIRYQYLTVKATNRASATIGIQNATRDDGLLVAFNSPYLHDSLAIEFSPPPGWLQVHPRVAQVPAGESMEFQVGFDATNRLGGTYHGRIEMLTNDPWRQIDVVPALLGVTGVARADVAPALLDFGVVLQGASGSLPLTVSNSGTDTLHMTAVAPALPFLTLDPSFLVVPPLEFAQFDVRITGTSPGPVATEIQFSTDAPGVALIRVPVIAEVVPPPVAALSLPSLAVELAGSLGPRASHTRQELFVRNDGDSPLEYRISATAPVRQPAVTRATASRRKGVAAAAGALGDGGPDAAGYMWRDDHAPDGLPFEWVDITAAGALVELHGDDEASEPIELPFDFPFYGSAFRSLRVTTNGFVSFTHAAAPYSNTPLPDTGPSAPENLIAVLWDDLDFRPAAGNARAYVWSDADRCIVSWHDVPHFASGAPSTFQLILHRDGAMDLQYLVVGERAKEATVGIQDETRSIGLQVVHAMPYVEDGLRVRIERLPAWLSASPLSGTVEPGESDTVSVDFDATGRAEGAYEGYLTIRTNDPAASVRLLTGRMTVAAARVKPQIDLDASGNGARWVEVAADVPAGLTLDDVLAAEAYLGQVRAVSSFERAGDAVFGFDRRALSAWLEVGPEVDIDFAGHVPGTVWFGGPVTLRHLPPARFDLAGDDLMPGDVLDLEWDATPGVTHDVWMSADGGATWSQLVERTIADRFEWEVLGTGGERIFELAAYDSAGYRGSAFAGPVEVFAAPAPPRFDLALAGPNPTSSGVTLRLAVPASGLATLRAYDVHGRLRRELFAGEIAAGSHTFAWDGSDRSGRRVDPGVYFVLARFGGEERSRRVVLIR